MKTSPAMRLPMADDSAASSGRPASMTRHGALLIVVVATMLAALTHVVGAQAIADPLVMRALELEGNGDPRQAAPLYRRALDGDDPVTALLGLERVYAELGLTDSLVVPLERVVARMPRDATVRGVQLRTLNTLQRGDDLRAAAQEWMRAAPGDPSPYRELARLLLADGRASAADSVISSARRALGGTAPLAQEIAQVRAAAGAWEDAAEAWRTALSAQPWLSQMAAYALTPTPEPRRAAVRAAFMKAPVDASARLALASLETRWGSAALGWDALRELPADSVSAEAWISFGELAELDGRWAQARVAFEAAMGWRASYSIRMRAAGAALASGDAAAAIVLAPVLSDETDSAHIARELLPIHVRALVSLGRAREAGAILDTFDRFLAPGPRAALAREVAMGWVRTGDMSRARAALSGAGEDADSSAAAGWIALYEGDAQTARIVLGRGEERTAEVALALAVLARFRNPAAPAVGTAFLTLARGDSAGAATRFTEAATATPRAASLLLLAAARLHLAVRDTTAAMELFDRIGAEHGESAEAPEALLIAARILSARSNPAGAIERLERLVLSYPASALVPVARRELELVRQPAAPSPG